MVTFSVEIFQKSTLFIRIYKHMIEVAARLKNIFKSNLNHNF